MVFILLGAVKAAKHARCEYNKDKKRNSVITPVDGSHDMMADRSAASLSSEPEKAGNTEWWGTTRAVDAVAPTPDAPPNHSGAGAWSRDHSIQQIADVNAEKTPSTYASSASGSTQLSAPIPRASCGPSAPTSPDEPVRPTSHGSGEIPLPAPIARDGQEPDTRPEGDHDSAFVERASWELNSGLERRTSRNEDSALLKDSSPADGDCAAAPVKQQSRGEVAGAVQPRRAKQVVKGSFEEALRRKPSVNEERHTVAKPEQLRGTVSALARNASKGPRMVPDRVIETASVPAKNESKGPVPTAGEGPREAVSALARNASKGPRRRLERSEPVVPPTGSFEASMGNSVARGGTGRGDDAGKATDGGQKGVSAFAGAATKKRVGRRPPTRGEADVGGGSMRPKASTAAATDGVAGSSMYAEGTMKKRTSRR